eukprot:CAMPEP_0203758400 /NCGR_PEP_ID=MMETSP0098-20131031/11214_1 /ASSEMBLY_ACC=CAM_ASM_000208 /TAXON_ID=96639 /ORGANISM=" , Strain NY0313808BC1" /LENGTH=45 /DNA_ID= /DNA_START= /DNA_END= /DNA_ORIENTATION=
MGTLRLNPSFSGQGEAAHKEKDSYSSDRPQQQPPSGYPPKQGSSG